MTEGPDVPFEHTEAAADLRDSLVEAIASIHDAQHRVSIALRGLPEGNLSRGALLYAQKKLDDAEIDLECSQMAAKGWCP